MVRGRVHVSIRVSAALTITLSGPALSAPLRPNACEQKSFEGSPFIACGYQARTDEVRLAWGDVSGPLGSLDALRRSLGKVAGRVHFAMNAGMYSPDQRPVGLFVAGGRTLQPLNAGVGRGNFFFKPNGVFWVGKDGRAHVEETGAFAKGRHDSLRWATQSGPLLVAGGRINGAFSADGVSRTIRNGVGVRNGEAVFVISSQPVSFGRFARLMRDELHAPNALYLDGSISSLWWPATGRLDGRTGLGPLVVVLGRKDPG